MMKRDSSTGKPWYKEFWAWFILAPLIVTIVVSAVTVTIAFKSKQDAVDNDYFKVGRLIDNTFAPLQAAKTLGVAADISFNPEYIDLALENGEWPLDDSLILQLSHPIDQDQDRYLTLKRIGENRFSSSAEIPTGRWYLLLSAIDDSGQEQWRLSGEIDFSQTTILHLP